MSEFRRKYCMKPKIAVSKFFLIKLSREMKEKFQGREAVFAGLRDDNCIFLWKGERGQSLIFWLNRLWFLDSSSRE